MPSSLFDLKSVRWYSWKLFNQIAALFGSWVESHKCTAIRSETDCLAVLASAQGNTSVFLNINLHILKGEVKCVIYVPHATPNGIATSFSFFVLGVISLCKRCCFWLKIKIIYFLVTCRWIMHNKVAVTVAKFSMQKLSHCLLSVM